MVNVGTLNAFLTATDQASAVFAQVARNAQTQMGHVEAAAAKSGSAFTQLQSQISTAGPSSGG